MHQDPHPAAPLLPAARLVGEPEHRSNEIHRSIVLRGGSVVNLPLVLEVWIGHVHDEAKLYPGHARRGLPPDSSSEGG
jgi:hypothetical protein